VRCCMAEHVSEVFPSRGENLLVCSRFPRGLTGAEYKGRLADNRAPNEEIALQAS
jgi:hypothetical protein